MKIRACEIVPEEVEAVRTEDEKVLSETGIHAPIGP